MKQTAIMMLALGALISAPAFAADEFGARFGGQAPAALGTATAPAPVTVAATPEELQTIVPAAGAETDEQLPTAAVTPEELQAIEPSNGKNPLPAIPAPQTP